MPYVLIQHDVSDYEVFKKVFDDDAPRRKMSGSKGGRLFHSVDDPAKLVALFEWDDLERAEKFARSYELREAVEWAGDRHPPLTLILADPLEVEA